MNEKEVAQNIYEHYREKLKKLPLRDGEITLHDVIKDYCNSHVDGWMNELSSLKKLSPTAISDRIKFFEQVKKEIELL